MGGVPVFVEVEVTRNHKEINVCTQVVAKLMEQQIAPVGLVGTVEETAAVLAQIAQEKLTPAIFIINTFGARDILPGLDALIGELPVVYVRREMFAGESGLLNNLEPPTDTSVTLQSMKMRLTSFWFYGSRNASEVAARLVPALQAFLQDGDFHHIERSCARMRSLVVADAI